MTSFKNLKIISVIMGSFALIMVVTTISAQTKITFSQANGGTVTAVDTVAKTVTISHVEPGVPCVELLMYPPELSCPGGKTPDILIQDNVLVINALDQVENDITKMKVGDTVTVYYRTEGTMTTPYAIKIFGLVRPGRDPITKICVVGRGDDTTPREGGGQPIPLPVAPGAPQTYPPRLCPTIVNDLSVGFQSDEIVTLQHELQILGYFPKEIQPTGFFGPITKQAVTDFQRTKGLPTTGYFGPMSRNALRAVTSP